MREAKISPNENLEVILKKIDKTFKNIQLDYTNLTDKTVEATIRKF